MLQHLVQSAPPWFTVKSHSLSKIQGVAHLASTNWTSSGIELTIKWDGAKIAVSESTPRTILPGFCPERHINDDASFCLGLKPVQPNDLAAADLWWLHLLHYLQCQHTASRVGIWSMHHARDHGKAGEFQEEAIELANELDASLEYERAYEGKPSWITDPSLHILHKDGRPINGRLPCPRGCRWKNRPSRPVVRKDCKHREKINRLVFVERQRRIALERFWNELKKTKTQCCGTMRDCPLK